MRLIRFNYNGLTYWGNVLNDLTTVETNLEMTKNLATFEDVITFFDKANSSQLFTDQLDLLDVIKLAPVIPTKNVMCIGKNYHDHILEFDGSAEDIERVKENPIFFSKAISSIIPANAGINSHPDVTSSVDYEAELAVIIGKTCFNVSVEEALDYVYAYTALNDITARDLQKKHQQWLIGKSLDTFCPIGPWLISKDQISDPQNLAIRSYVNGDVRQDANTSLMIHDICAQISVLSKGMTLNPGDIIATGTPKGVGMGFNPPKFLKAGDEVEIYIDEIGSLINHVI